MHDPLAQLLLPAALSKLHSSKQRCLLAAYSTVALLQADAAAEHAGRVSEEAYQAAAPQNEAHVHIRW